MMTDPDSGAHESSIMASAEALSCLRRPTFLVREPLGPEAQSFIGKRAPPSRGFSDENRPPGHPNALRIEAMRQATSQASKLEHKASFASVVSFSSSPRRLENGQGLTPRRGGVPASPFAAARPQATWSPRTPLSPPRDPRDLGSHKGFGAVGSGTGPGRMRVRPLPSQPGGDSSLPASARLSARDPCEPVVLGSFVASRSNSFAAGSFAAGSFAAAAPSVDLVREPTSPFATRSKSRTILSSRSNPKTPRAGPVHADEAVPTPRSSGTASTAMASVVDSSSLRFAAADTPRDGFVTAHVGLGRAALSPRLPQHDSPAIRETVKGLVRRGLSRQANSEHTLRPRGVPPLGLPGRPEARGASRKAEALRRQNPTVFWTPPPEARVICETAKAPSFLVREASMGSFHSTAGSRAPMAVAGVASAAAAAAAAFVQELL